MFNKPNDIVIIFGIFALVMVTVGFGITSAVNHGVPADTNTTSYITNLKSNINSDYVSTGQTIKEGVLENENGSISTGVTGIITRGYNSLLRLGEAYDIMHDSVVQTQTLLGIDSIYWIILSVMVLITLAVVMWTWVIGGQ